jgi:hypothetical protein
MNSQSQDTDELLLQQSDRDKFPPIELANCGITFDFFVTIPATNKISLTVWIFLKKASRSKGFLPMTQ